MALTKLYGHYIGWEDGEQRHEVVAQFSSPEKAEAYAKSCVLGCYEEYKRNKFRGLLYGYDYYEIESGIPLDPEPEL